MTGVNGIGGRGSMPGLGARRRYPKDQRMPEARIHAIPPVRHMKRGLYA